MVHWDLSEGYQAAPPSKAEDRTCGLLEPVLDLVRHGTSGAAWNRRRHASGELKVWQVK
jgi:hypothetical protein